MAAWASKSTIHTAARGQRLSSSSPKVSWYSLRYVNDKIVLLHSSVLSFDRSICSWANAPYYYLSNTMRADSYIFFLGNGILQSSFPLLSPTYPTSRQEIPVFLTRHHLETVSGEVPCLREHGLTSQSDMLTARPSTTFITTKYYLTQECWTYIVGTKT